MLNSNKGSLLILLIIIITTLLSSLLLFNLFYKKKNIDMSSKTEEIKIQTMIPSIKKLIKKILSSNTSNINNYSIYKYITNIGYTFQLNNFNINIKIQDEDSKINVNNLLYANYKLSSIIETQIKFIFNKLNINEENIDILIDWMDKDNNTSTNGAENDYYNNLKNKYNCSNNYFQSLEELKLLKNLKNYFYTNENDSQSLLTYLTIYGDKKVNVNTVSENILRSFDVLDEIEISEILNYRENSTIKKIEDLKTHTNISEENYKIIDGYLKTNSDYFKILLTFQTEKINKKFYLIYSDKTKNFLYFNSF